MATNVNKTWEEDRNGREIFVGDRVRIDDDYYNLHCFGRVTFVPQDPFWNPMGGEIKIMADDGSIMEANFFNLCIDKAIEVVTD